MKVNNLKITLKDKTVITEDKVDFLGITSTGFLFRKVGLTESFCVLDDVVEYTYELVEPEQQELPLGGNVVTIQ